MDDLLELLMDVLLEGTTEAAVSEKVPLRVRIVLILVLGIGFVGVFGLMFWVGFDTGNKGLMLLGLAFITGGMGWIWYKCRGFWHRRKRREKNL